MGCRHGCHGEKHSQALLDRTTPRVARREARYLDEEGANCGSLPRGEVEGGRSWFTAYQIPELPTVIEDSGLKPSTNHTEFTPMSAKSLLQPSRSLFARRAPITLSIPPSSRQSTATRSSRTPCRPHQTRHASSAADPSATSSTTSRVLTGVLGLGLVILLSGLYLPRHPVEGKSSSHLGSDISPTSRQVYGLNRSVHR